ncbi:ABC transporter substrate-binding protein [Jatrophihabitans sp. YIM 134969]
MTSRPTRLSRLAAVTAALVALTLTLAACGSGGDDASGAAGGSGPWSFTDDLGKTISLDETPDRVAGYSDPLGSLWSYGIEPVASFGQTPISDEPGFDGKDTSGVTEVGRAYGEINIESLAAARPDIVVVTHYPTARGKDLDPDGLYYGFKDLAQQKAVAAIAPLVVIGVSGEATDVADRIVDLAVSLGVDEDSGVIADSRADFQAAADRLKAAAASGLTVSAIAGYVDDGVYVARWQDDPLLNTWHTLGVDVPDLPGDNYYWLQTSWENIADQATDVVLYSERAMDADALGKQAGFSQTPAATSGQLHPWAVVAFDYVAMARDTDDLAGWLEGSEPVA